MNKILKIIMVIILGLLLFIIPTNSYASNYKTEIIYKGVDRAPRVQYDRSNKDEIIIKLIDNGSIYSVKLEKIENGKATELLNKSPEKSTIKKGISISNDLKEIKINKSLLKINIYTQFRITTSDNSSIKKNKLVSNFKIKRLENKDSKKGWYGINNSPRLKYDDGLIVKTNDNNEVKSLIIKDMNNNNANVEIGNAVSGSTETVKRYKIDLSKLVAKNNMYFLKVEVTDKCGMKRTEEIIVKTEIKKTETTEEQKDLKVLFVGNSKTYKCNTPEKFQKLAEEAGYKVTITKAVKGGKTLSYLAENKKSIINKAYDIVILQEATDNYQNNYSEFLKGAQAISEMVRKQNANVKIYVRQTWALSTTTDNNKSKAYNNAVKVANKIGASLIYDGKAIYKLGVEKGFQDKKHQTEQGAYLTACAIYNAVFKKSPVGLNYTAGLDKNTAKNLQQIANTVYKAQK